LVVKLDVRGVAASDIALFDHEDHHFVPT
jgi:hypothetical protein